MSVGNFSQGILLHREAGSRVGNIIKIHFCSVLRWEK